MLRNPQRGAAALALAAALACAPLAWAQKAKPAEAAGTAVVAEVAGEKITRAELEKSLSAQLAELERQRHQILEAGVNDLVDDRLFAKEAAARGVSKEALIKTEVTDKTQVTDAEIDTWFEQNKGRLGGRSKEQVGPQIRQFLQNQKAGSVRSEYISTLRAKYPVKVLFEPLRVNVAATGPSKGPANAPVTIVEFSDFQCPFCSRVNPTLQQVLSTYGDKVRIVFRHFPLPMHKEAPKAHEASICADEQGQFWAMHDALFANQQALGIDGLKQTAANLKLDTAKFNACLDSGKHAAKVQADLQDGGLAGVNGTPAFFVNGRFLNGAVPFEQFKAAIDAELAMRGLSAASK